MPDFWKKLKKPVIGLSPMAGVTDEPMRLVQAEIAKPDVMFTEFISVEGFLRKKEFFRKHLLFIKNERPIVVQVFGADPDAFSHAVPEIIRFGFDGIDINMGCPSRSVLEKGGGGALIGNYKNAQKIIETVLNSIKKTKIQIPLSIKTRIGKDSIISEEWAGFLSEFPLSEVCIHGRLLNQGLSGPVNWDQISVFAEIFRSKGILTLGNGGVKSISEAKEKCKTYCLDGVLIGRGALGNPWIFKNDYVPSREEILQTILIHGKQVWDIYGPDSFIRARKHFGWYPKDFKGSKYLRVRLLRTNNMDDVIKIIEEFKKKYKY